MKALYDRDGISPQEEVTIVGWDCDKWVEFIDSKGNNVVDKRWKLNLKISNRMYKLPDIYEKEQPTKRQAASFIKKRYKPTMEFSVWLENNECKRFKHLKKALNFARVNKCKFVQACYSAKRHSILKSIVVFEDGFWYCIRGKDSFVSQKTLVNWVMSTDI